MGRAASKKNIARAHSAHETSPDAIGPRLGILVYRSNVPAASVAIALHVSLPTLYRWFYGINGSDVAPEFRKRVIRFSGILEDALETGILPAQGSLEQRIQVLVGVVRNALAKPTT